MSKPRDLSRLGLYLWARGLSGQAPDALQFVEALEYRDDAGVVVGHYPAMVADVVNLAGKTVSIHRTYLDPAALGKAPEIRAKKLTPAVVDGATMGAAIHLAPAGPTLALAEGIETGVAVQEATGTPTWSTVSAAGMARVELPKTVKRVEIWADNDTNGVGQQAAQRAAERLRDEGREVVVLTPRLPEQDWLDVLCDWGPEELAKVAHQAREEAAQENLTDIGNARRLARCHGRNLWYDHKAKVWFVWNTNRWKPDDKGAPVCCAKDTVQTIYQEAAQLADKKDRAAMASHAMKSESDRAVRAMLSLAQSEPGIAVSVSDFDRDPWLLNVLNGTIDLRHELIRPHRRADLITKLAPVTYDDTAKAPRWRQFIDEVTGGDEGLAFYLQQIAGYSLTGDVREDCFFIHYGSGRNGKGVFLTMLREVVGDHSMQISPDLLMVSRKTGEAATPELADLRGVRLAVASEAESGQRLAEGLIKQLTGRDPIKARPLYSPPIEFNPIAKLHLATNHRPTIAGTDPAIWARIRLIPWEVSFLGREEKDLTDKLRAELPGILNWALAGCLAWQQDGLQTPSAVARATDKYRSDSDALGEFLEGWCLVGPGCALKAGTLYDAYRQWAEGVGERTITQRRFSQVLTERGFQKGPRTRTGYMWHGLTLRDDVCHQSRPPV